MSKVSKQLVRHKTLVQAVVTGVLAGLLLVAGAIPLISRARSLAKKIDSRRVEANELANRVAVLSGIDKSVLKQRLEIIDKALPPKKDVLLYLSAVDGLSRELGLTFAGISLTPGEVTEASASAGAKGGKKIAGSDVVPGVHTLETEVKINGTKDNIYTFLRLVEQALPLMQVKDLTMTASGGDNFVLSVRLGMLWASGDLGQVKGAIKLFNDKEESYFQQLSTYRRFTQVALDTGGTPTGKQDLFSPVAEVPVVNLVESEVASDEARPQ